MTAGVASGIYYAKQAGWFAKARNYVAKSVSTENGSLDVSGFKLPGSGGK